MSLINEALKKAQRSRTAGHADEMAPLPGGGPVARRREARSVNTIVLIGSAAVVLVVLSVVATVYFVNRPAPAPTAPIATRVPEVAPDGKELAPTIIVPPIAAAPVATAASVPPPQQAPATATPAKAPPSTTAVVPRPPASTTTSPPAAKPPAASRRPAPADPAVPLPSPVATPPSTPAPVVTQTPAVSAPPSPPPIVFNPDERVAAYIEAMRISGVRASGADSRVLINDRVYRLNDIIERTLGIRLTEVAQGRLTFTDSNGVTYVKYL